MPSRPARSLGSFLSCALCLGGAAVANAGADFDATNVDWNGSARLVALGRSLHLDVRPSHVLDLGALTTRSSVLVLGPLRAVPDELVRFVRAGGRVAVADDVGSGAPFFARYALERVAEPRVAMGLSLVTNHPAALRSPGRVPLLAFSGDDGLVHAVRDGDGELVALGDPSLLTNQMLPFADNEHFAAALLRYLTRGTKARTLHVVWGRFEVRGALPPLLGARTGAAMLADSARALSEEGAFGVNAVAWELMAHRPVGGILMALAVFASGGALLLFAALWGGSIPIGGRRRPRREDVQRLDVPEVEALSSGERGRLGAALRAAVEARAAECEGRVSVRRLRSILAEASSLPKGESDPLAHRVSARRLRRVCERAEKILGPLVRSA